MPSYQDLDMRLRVLEDRISFVMQAVRMPVKVGLIDPQIKAVSLLDLYFASKQAVPQPLSSQVIDAESVIDVQPDAAPTSDVTV